jgi:predicted nucleic acid-binding protein
MSVAFLDTNILLRHILNDDPIKSPACFALVQAIERGETMVWTSELAIAEVVFVLESKRTYNVPRDTIRDALLPLLGLPGIKLTHKRLYRRVFDLYTRLPIDFIDCYHVALMEQRGNRTLFSYDTDFEKISDVIRREP